MLFGDTLFTPAVSRQVVFWGGPGDGEGKVVRNASHSLHQTALAQSRSTAIISMIDWIRTSRLSIKKSHCTASHALPPVWFQGCVRVEREQLERFQDL